MEKEVGAAHIAAIVVEPILGEGGSIVPAPGYFAAVADFAQANGIVFVADEIQSGFARTGDGVASEFEGVVPDLITTAQGIAGAMLLAAVTGRAEMMDLVHGGGLGGTYGGNPVASTAALGSISWLQENHPTIGDIRGRGAIIAIDLVTLGTLEPDAARTAALNKYCHQHSVVTLTAGT